MTFPNLSLHNVYFTIPYLTSSIYGINIFMAKDTINGIDMETIEKIGRIIRRVFRCAQIM